MNPKIVYAIRELETLDDRDEAIDITDVAPLPLSPLAHPYERVMLRRRMEGILQVEVDFFYKGRRGVVAMGFNSMLAEQCLTVGTHENMWLFGNLNAKILKLIEQG